MPETRETARPTPQMSVHYCAIGYKQTVLAQSALNQKALQAFGENINATLGQFTDKGDMQTSSNANQDFNFYIKSQNGITCTCFTDKQVQKGQAYGMMNEIIQQFSTRYSLEAVKLASKLQFDREFASIIQNNMNNVKKFTSNTAELQKELDEVKGLVMDNISQVMKRASQLESIENDAVELKDNALLFAESSKDLRKKMMCKKVSMIVGICVAVVVIALVIILPIVL